ncbi:MAG: hypothetical protein ACP5MG_12095 [Verrucomicrobiia bacterium]
MVRSHSLSYHRTPYKRATLVSPKKTPTPHTKQIPPVLTSTLSIKELRQELADLLL